MIFPVGIIGIGKCVPDTIVTNQDLVAGGLDTTDEWIVSRTGIRERRIADAETRTSHLAYGASQDAIKDAGISPTDIDMVIVATSTPDFALFPSTACLLQDRLGLRKDIGAVDVSAACTGFNYALSMAEQYVATGSCRYVLVVAGDVLSRHLDWTDRSICILFGDGAGACVVGQVPEGLGLIDSKLYSDGSYADILQVKPDGPSHIYMDGRAVFKVAVNAVVPAVEAILQKNGLSGSDVDLLVLHQANLRIIEATRERLGIPEDRVMKTIEIYGNTSAASIPMALCDAKQAGRLKRGDVVLLAGFGAGFTWGTTLFRWAY